METKRSKNMRMVALALSIAFVLMTGGNSVSAIADTLKLSSPTENSVVINAVRTEPLTVTKAVNPDNPGMEDVVPSDTVYLKNQTFDINRDYEQECMISVVNNTNNPQEIYLEVVNSNSDLSMEIIKAGSKNSPLTIPVGETAEVELSVFAQNAQNSSYSIPVRMYLWDEGKFIYESKANIILNCTLPSINLTWVQTNEDSSTLKKTFSVTNKGDNLSDVSITASDDLKDYLIFDPIVTNHTMNMGSNMTFSVAPDFTKMKSAGLTSLSGSLIASCAGQQSVQPVIFDTYGKEITVTTMGELANKQDGNPYTKFDVLEETIRIESFDGSAYTDVTQDVKDGKSALVNDDGLINMRMETVVDLGTAQTNAEFIVKSEKAPKDSVHNSEPIVTQVNNGINIRMYVTAAQYQSMLAGQNVYSIMPMSFDDVTNDYMIDVTFTLVEDLGPIGNIKSVYDICKDTGEMYDFVSNPYIPKDVRENYSNAYAAKTIISYTSLALGLIEFTGPAGIIIGLTGTTINYFIGLYQEYLKETYGNNSALNYNFLGRQCTNRGNVTISFYVPDYNGVTPDIVISNRMYRNGYVNKQDTDYDVYLNGKRVSTTQNQGLTQLAFATISKNHNIRLGQLNTITLDYNTSPGSHFVSTDFEVNLVYPKNSQIGFVGTPEDVRDVRSLPDFAVYPENIYTTVDLIENEPAELSFDVSNRGTEGGWCRIEVFERDTVIFTQDNVYFDPASRQIVTLSNWLPTSGSPSVTVKLTALPEGEVSEKKYNNNTAAKEIQVRQRQVPIINEILVPNPDNENPISISADIQNYADVTNVSFAVDGVAVTGAVSSGVKSDMMSYRVSTLDILDANDHTITVTAEYNTADGTAAVSESVVVNVFNKKALRFSFDCSIENPYISLYNRRTNSISTIIYKDSPGTYSFLRTQDMIDNSQDYMIFVRNNDGYYFSPLIDNLTISADNCRSFSFENNPNFDIRYIKAETSDGVNVNSSSITNFPCLLTPGRYTFTVSGYYLNKFSFTQKIEVDVTDGDVVYDPSDLVTNYVFTITGDTANEYNAYVYYRMSDSNTYNISSIYTDFNSDFKVLSCIIADEYTDTQIENAAEAHLVIYSDKEAYTYPIKTKGRQEIVIPLALSREDLIKVEIGCSNKEFNMESVNISNDIFFLRFDPGAVWLPKGMYTFTANLKANGIIVNSTVNVVVDSEKSLDMAENIIDTYNTVTLNWASQFDKTAESAVVYSTDGYVMFNNADRGIAVKTVSANNNVRVNLTKGSFNFTVNGKTTATNPDMNVSDCFSGDINCYNKNEYMLGDTISLDLNNLKDENGNELNYVYASGSSKFTAVITYTDVTDNTKQFITTATPYSLHLYGIKLPDTEGAYHVALQMFTDPGAYAQHEHIYNKKLAYNGAGHFYLCTICAASGEVAAHNLYTNKYGKKVCSDCGYMSASDTPCDHVYGSEYCTNETKHWHECSCGDKTDIADHVSNGGMITVPPTPTSTGIRTYSCSVCGYVISTEIIPATETIYPYVPSHPSYNLPSVVIPPVAYASVLEVKAEVNGDSVTLIWNKIKGAEKYTVFQYKNGKYVKLKETSKTTVTYKKLKNGKTYKFLVKYTRNGRSSSTANSGKVSVIIMYKPIVKASSTENSINLKWSPIDGAEKYAVYKYANGKVVKLTETKKTSVKIKKLKSNTKYNYIVCAYVDGKWTSMKKSDIVMIKTQ